MHTTKLAQQAAPKAKSCCRMPRYRCDLPVRMETDATSTWTAPCLQSESRVRHRTGGDRFCNESIEGSLKVCHRSICDSVLSDRLLVCEKPAMRSACYSSKII